MKIFWNWREEVVAQRCAYTKHHWIVHFKMHNCMLCGLHLNKNNTVRIPTLTVIRIKLGWHAHNRHSTNILSFLYHTFITPPPHPWMIPSSLGCKRKDNRIFDWEVSGNDEEEMQTLISVHLEQINLGQLSKTLVSIKPLRVPCLQRFKWPLNVEGCEGTDAACSVCSTSSRAGVCQGSSES